MADRKISDLTALTAPASGDYLPIVDISEAAAANKNKRITIEELFRGIPLGTAAAPSIAIEGDEDTGVYSPGANQLAISTNGTGRLFVDASGNVGVGTASEPRRLHVSNGYSAATSIDGSIALLVTNNAGANDFAGVGIIGGGTSGGSFIHFGDTANAGIGRIGYFHSDDSFRFNTNGNERLRITSTGTVNIVGAGTAGSTQAVSFNGSAPVNSLVVDSSGRCGIGTSTPGYLLEASRNTAGDVVAFTASTDRLRPLVFSSSDNTASGAIWTRKIDSAFGIHAWSTNSLERMRIDASGRVGIGTTSPQGKLIVSNGGANGIEFFPDTDSGVNSTINSFNRSSSTFSALSINAAQHIFLTSSTERARIDSSGRLLVGTSTNSGGSLLQVNDNRIRIATAKTPASATDTGTTGEVCWDANYVYVCTATNTWKRSALATW